MKLTMPSAKTRTYLYNVALALVPLLVAAGLLASTVVPLVLAAVAAVLGLGMARANVSK